METLSITVNDSTINTVLAAPRTAAISSILCDVKNAGVLRDIAANAITATASTRYDTVQGICPVGSVAPIALMMKPQASGQAMPVEANAFQPPDLARSISVKFSGKAADAVFEFVMVTLPCAKILAQVVCNPLHTPKERARI